MTARFLVVPQWQASASSRAMRHVDGARALHGDLPRNATTLLETPQEAGDAVETGVHRYTAVAAVAALASSVLEELPSPVVLLGGDSAADYAGAAAAVRADDVALVWLGARAALHTPADSPNGAFASMALRTLLGDGPEELAGAARPERVVLAGVRDLDPAEEAHLANRPGLAVVDADALAEPGPLLAAIAATGARRVYLHLDLDVLDPAWIGSVPAPEPFGATAPALCAAIRAIRRATPLAGAGITGFAPASELAAANDLPTILRLLSALTGPLEEAAS